MPVEEEEKEKRATEIAGALGDNKLWHSHGRSIGIDALTKIVKLKIEDYSNDKELTKLIRDYNDLICQYISRMQNDIFFHTRKFI